MQRDEFQKSTDRTIAFESSLEKLITSISTSNSTSFIKNPISPSLIFSSAVCDAISLLIQDTPEGMKAKVYLGGNFTLYYSKSNHGLEISKSELNQFEPDSLVFKLDKNNLIEKISVHNPKLPSTRLEILDFFHGCAQIKMSGLENFGFSKEEIEYADSTRGVRIQNAIYIKNSKDDPNSFTQIADFSESESKVLVVRQGEAVFTSSSAGALYTYHASNCAILAIKAIDSGGRICSVGLAHIDPDVPYAEIQKIYSSLQSALPSDSKLESYIVGARPDLTLKIMDVAKKNKSETKFVSADIDELKSDSLLIDASGKIYYGELPNLSDAQSILNLDRKRTESSYRGMTVKILEK